MDTLHEARDSGDLTWGSSWGLRAQHEDFDG